MELQAESTSLESVIVVTDANKNKGNVDALAWALKHVVRRRDTVIVMGVLSELGKKNSCFPLNKGISISGIWERLEFSNQGHGDVRPRELGEEIERIKEQYQNDLQPFYRQCKKNEVKLELKLAFGFCPQKIAVEQAQKSNARWVVLESHLKKYKLFIYGQVRCNIAVMKGKAFATLIPSRGSLSVDSPGNRKTSDHNGALVNSQEGESSNQMQPPQEPCWYPLSWRDGFPRAFSESELQVITNDFDEDNLIRDEDNIKRYEGLLQDAPVMVYSFSEEDERFWSTLKILSRIHHRNVTNLVGYCCTGTSGFLLIDYPIMESLEVNLLHCDLARNLTWKARWSIALEIGRSLRYLHEECRDGAIVHRSVCSSHIFLSYGCSIMLANFITASWFRGDGSGDDGSPTECTNAVDEDNQLSIDVHGYGVLLIELMAGKSARLYQNEGGEETLIDWALPLLENGSITDVLDPRLEDNDDTIDILQHMATAALLCLRNDSDHRLSMSEVLAVVRGDQLAVTNCQSPLE